MELYELLGENPSDSGHVHARQLTESTSQLIQDLVGARKAALLSQIDVAKAMGTSQASISRFETGLTDVHLSTLRRYAKAVGAVFDFKVRHFKPDALPALEPDAIPALEPWPWEAQMETVPSGASK